MRAKIRLLVGPALVPVLVTLFLFSGQAPTATPTTAIKGKIIQRELNFELGKAKRPKWAQKVSSGAMYNFLMASGLLDNRAAPGARPQGNLSVSDTEGCPLTLTGFGRTNVRVNQDCGLRRQAEETIAVNPRNRRNLIVGQNDSRLGFNQCGFDWSNDGGNHWGDGNPPFHQEFLDNGHVGDFCSDPTVTFDSDGNAFFGGLQISIDSLGDEILVARSDAGINGAFYHDPDQTDPFHTYKDTPLGVVDSVFDETGCAFDDKELMTADAHNGSPKANNLYMVWTLFRCTDFGVFFDSPIYFSQSLDGGVSWSTRIEISGSNAKACTDFSGEEDPNACDQDQGGHPVVGPDGTVYVGFGNGNTPEFGINQHMVVSCPPTADCSQQASWTSPTKISDDFGLQPIENDGTNLVSGCPGGRQCLPPNGYRLDDFVEGSISVDNNGDLYFAWADGRNIGSPCDTLDYDTASPPCNNDVFYSYSTDGGSSWNGPYLVTGNAGETAQWQPWSVVAGNGHALWVAYYSREFANCEFDGCNDIVLAKVAHPKGSKTITYTRLSTSSMPNLIIANNPVQAGFLGDYMWITLDGKGQPYVVWADTRGRGGGVVEEDIYFSVGS
jgi:hypothetical protein